MVHDENVFDTHVHHYDGAGNITKVNAYQLSIIGGAHYYYRHGKVYQNNNKEVAFELIPDQLKKQWGILSREDQAKAILHEKIAERKKVEASLKAATKELARLQAEERLELQKVKHDQAALSKKLADEEAEAKASYAAELKAAEVASQVVEEPGLLSDMINDPDQGPSEIPE